MLQARSGAAALVPPTLSHGPPRVVSPRDLLTTIPGIGPLAAAAVLSEIGASVAEFFPYAAHLASWAGMCPGSHESAGKRHSGKRRHGNQHLQPVLVEAAWEAIRHEGCLKAGPPPDPAPPGTSEPAITGRVRCRTPGRGPFTYQPGTACAGRGIDGETAGQNRSGTIMSRPFTTQPDPPATNRPPPVRAGRAPGSARRCSRRPPGR